MANAAEERATGSGCGGCQNESWAEDYWTEERCAQAEHQARTTSLPMPKAGAGELAATTGEALANEPPGSASGYDPHSHDDENSYAPELGLRDAGADVKVSKPLMYPWRTVGKLRYVQDGKPDAGSGALITPNIVLTAGHCIFDSEKGGKSIEVYFYPSYGVGAEGRDKNNRFYELHCSFLAWRLAWSEDHNWAYDYGLAWIDSAPGNDLGWLGYAWGQTTQNRRWTAYGYPPDNPDALNSGATMKAVLGRNTESRVPGMIAMTNNLMEHGASGGPWVTTDPLKTNPNDHSLYHVNGVHSLLHSPPLPQVAHSPYFTEALPDLVKWISNPANRK